MKKAFVAIAASAAALVSMTGTANAAPYGSFNQRDARIEQQINHGVRSGALTRNEARSLSVRLNSIQRLERSFRRNGLTMSERRALDVRYDALSRSIRVQLTDNQFNGRRGFHRF